MGYELDADMIKGDEIKNFTIAPTRSRVVSALESIAAFYPDTLEKDPSGYHCATITAEQAVPMLEGWHRDLVALTSYGPTDDDNDAYKQVASINVLGENIHNCDYAYPLAGRIKDMLDLAKQGYAARFYPT